LGRLVASTRQKNRPHIGEDEAGAEQRP